MAISAYITSGSSSYPIIKWLRANTPMKIILECSPEYLFSSSKIFVNGNWVGVIDTPVELVNLLKLYRRNGIIPIFTSISFDYEHNTIFIYSVMFMKYFYMICCRVRHLGFCWEFLLLQVPNWLSCQSEQYFYAKS